MASGVMHILAAFFAQERKETLLPGGAAALHLWKARHVGD
jgi:hypothetical protein